MCYDVRYMTKLRLAYAKRRGRTEEEIADLETRLHEVEQLLPPHFHANGFAHPSLLVFTGDEPLRPQLFHWGLIPFWVKDEAAAAKISDQTLNARGESVFEKPSFRQAARRRRCLIMVDGFFEHHRYQGKAYPFHIQMKNEEPMVFGGIWEKWALERTGITRYSVSIVTTRANELMAKIHNNPDLPEPRMPFIIPRELESDWLGPLFDPDDVTPLKDFIQPYLDSSELKAYSVGPIRGKAAIGNRDQAVKPFGYEGLPALI